MGKRLSQCYLSEPSLVSWWKQFSEINKSGFGSFDRESVFVIITRPSCSCMSAANPFWELCRDHLDPRASWGPGHVSQGKPSELRQERVSVAGPPVRDPWLGSCVGVSSPLRTRAVFVLPPVSGLRLPLASRLLPAPSASPPA